MRTHKTAWLVAILALLAPAAAWATINPVGATAWTLWAFGNGNVLYNLLYAAKGLVASSGYLALVGFLAMLGIIATSVMTAHNALESRRLLVTILATFAFLTIGLRETANVMVDDPVTGYINTVANVPSLVAIPPAVISAAGQRMTQLLEQFYSLPGDLTLTGGAGFDLANSLVNAEAQVQVTSPYLRSTIASFAQNCIMPALASGQLNAGQLATSTALWSVDGQTGTLASVAQSPATPVFTGSTPYGELIPCGPGGYTSGDPTVTSSQYPSVSGTDAYDYISQYFQAASPDWLANSASTYSGTSAYSWLGTTLTSAEQWDFGTALTQSTGETIAQAAAVNMMQPAMLSAAVASGSSPLVTSLAVAQGQQSQISSWATAAALFRDLSGYIFSVLQAFILAIAPIILVIAVLPGAGKRVLMSYGQVLVWLALWEPTMSLINFIIALYAQGNLGPTMGSSGGFSMMNQGVITQMTSNMELAAGFLASTVPLITWGLVKGGIAFTDFVVGAVGSSFATTAGAMAATGNVSLGNVSMGNDTLDQQMLARKTTFGTAAPDAEAPPEGVDYMAHEGGRGLKTPTGNMSISQTTASAETIASAESTMRSAGTSYSENMSRARNLTAGVMASLGGHYSESDSASHLDSAGRVTSLSDSGVDRISSGVSQAAATRYDEKHMKDLGAGMSLMLSAGARQQVADKVSKEAEEAENPQQKSKLMSFLSGLTGIRPGMRAQLDGSTKIADSGSHDASHTTSSGHDDSMSRDASAKRDHQDARNVQHAAQFMQTYVVGKDVAEKSALAQAAGFASSAKEDATRMQSASQALSKQDQMTVPVARGRSLDRPVQSAHEDVAEANLDTAGKRLRAEHDELTSAVSGQLAVGKQTEAAGKAAATAATAAGEQVEHQTAGLPEALQRQGQSFKLNEEAKRAGYGFEEQTRALQDSRARIQRMREIRAQETQRSAKTSGDLASMGHAVNAADNSFDQFNVAHQKGGPGAGHEAGLAGVYAIETTGADIAGHAIEDGAKALMAE